MSVRAYSSRARSGYGVIGDAFSIDNNSIRIGLADVIPDLWQVYLDNKAPSDGAFAAFVYLRWRYSVSILNFDNATLRKYDVNLGKSQFGTARMSAYNYVTDEQFISYAKDLSPLYGCAFRLLGGEIDPDDLPCSEPQDTVPDLRFPDTGAMFYSSLIPADSFQPNSWQFNTVNQIADMVDFFMHPSVLRVRIGATYVYRIFGYTTDEWLEANNPPLVVL